ncbi:hypothetical protein ACFQ7F_45640 [Streptomyces sp. NPDC056486]|uniref:hypothetical protein n=1 Tax=Streptomyces sp. NPDC056486 TaxID=3345835 RepID=UPI0036ADDC7E
MQERSRSEPAREAIRWCRSAIFTCRLRRPPTGRAVAAVALEPLQQYVPPGGEVEVPHVRAFLRGLSVAETARIMGKNEGAIKTL